MKSTRIQRAKINMVSTLGYQLVSIISGMLIPRFLIGSFGSSVYGAASSIGQFLSYVTLLEGGIGGVARAELYQPLALNNKKDISKIYNTIVRYFRIIGVLFLTYTVILACVYPKIADVSFFSTDYTFFLVIAISLSTVAQYFFGIANLTLLNADQKRYISNMVMIVTTVVNAVMVIMLVNCGCDILTVKLCSSSIFVLRPIIFSLYVQKHYQLDASQKGDKTVLKQKWTGLGQHLAYYLHTNTDVVILTILSDLKNIAVYSIYNLVVSSIRNIVTALTGGMEAIFGEMIAKKEEKELSRAYWYYELIISFVSLVLFGAAAILIIPFVKLYTKDFSDALYVQPLFALIILITEAINCIFLPCCALPIAANQFKETRWGAYGEALINVVVSCILVVWNPLLGVAIGTAVSVVYKNIYYYWYVSKNILHTSIRQGKNYLLYMFALLTITIVGNILIDMICIDSMIKWAVCGVVVVLGTGMAVSVFYTLLYGSQFFDVAKRLLGKFVVFGNANSGGK